MTTAVSALQGRWSWTDWGTSPQKDSAFILLAILLHMPLAWVRLQSITQRGAGPRERLENIDFVEELPRSLAFPAPPARVEQGLLSKVVHFFKPPPALEIKPPEQHLEIARPEAAKLQENLAKPLEEKPKPLLGKEFKDKLTPSPSLENKPLITAPAVSQISLGQKLETKVETPSLKDRGGFQMSRSQLPAAIGDALLKVPGAPPAEAIQIPIGKRASAEQLAPLPTSTDRGAFKASPGTTGAGVPIAGGRPSDVQRAPSRLVVPAIPIDAPARRSQGQDGDLGLRGSKDFKEQATRPQAPLAAEPIARASPDLEANKPSQVSTNAMPAKRPKRSLFQITGPLANRRILVQKVPLYPAWAQAKGIVASVVLEFIVTPEGSVLGDNILVKRTSGTPEFDDLAVEALKAWKFAPLGADENQNQAGTIVFNYALQ